MTIARLSCFLALLLLPNAASAQDGWLLFHGNAQRAGAASRLPAWAKRVAWQRPLLMDKLYDDGKPDPDDAAKELIDKLRKDADPTILPGFFPLLVNGACIYRNHRDVCGVSMQEIALTDATGHVGVYPPSTIIWKSAWLRASLSDLLQKKRPGSLTTSIDLLRLNKQEHWLWANPLIGSLSSDSQFIYSIDDFPFPKTDAKAIPKLVISDELKPFFTGNRLHAYDVPSGKLTWDTGPSGFSPTPTPFDDTYFLGAPLPHGGELYVLNEKSDDLRLLAMNLDRKKWKKEIDPEFAKSLSLAKIPQFEQIQKSPLRRTQPLHIAHADGLLVCPTHAGVLFGVDRAKMSIRWQYRYRPETTALPTLPYWQAACPIIIKDRILFTAADAPEIHCLGLDGKKKWTAQADKDLYLATVHDDIVLLVGKTHCRALDLADGKQKWQLAMGLPAGVGVKDGSLYYLPLQRDAITQGPRIWAIDLATGKLAHRIDVPHPAALGNLALHRGMIVTQSVTHIAAFPLTTKMP